MMPDLEMSLDATPSVQMNLPQQGSHGYDKPARYLWTMSTGAREMLTMDIVGDPIPVYFWDWQAMNHEVTATQW